MNSGFNLPLVLSNERLERLELAREHRHSERGWLEDGWIGAKSLGALNAGEAFFNQIGAPAVVGEKEAPHDIGFGFLERGQGVPAGEKSTSQRASEIIA